MHVSFPLFTPSTGAILCALAFATNAVAQDPGVDHRLHLGYATFDPVRDGVPPMSPLLAEADGGTHLFIVQFDAPIADRDRQALRDAGAAVQHYLPSQSYLVRMTTDVAAAVREQRGVRWVGAYHPAFRLDPQLVSDLTTDALPTRARYHVMPVDHRQDSAALEAAIAGLGGTVDSPAQGGNLIVASLTPAQLAALSHHDTVLWIDRWSPWEADMDNGRVQSGAEALHGLATPIDGKGMRAHSFDTGFTLTHPEFGARAPYRVAPIPVLGTGNDSHGSSVIGIVGAEGLNPQAKGMMPFAQLLVTGFSQGISNRYALARTLRDPSGTAQAMASTSSVSQSRTLTYTSVSANTDLWIFDFDLFYTQSQSNASSQMSRPEAWAKNTASVAGFNHFNNTNPNDDRFANGSSRGPASDTRYGVTFAGYYDSIFTTTSNGRYTTFCCTSGATPMVNGLAGLVMQIFTDGHYGYPGVGWQDRFDALPHFTTTKAVMMATTRPMPPSRATRVQQGWGFPNALDAYDLRDRMLVVDEEDVLTQGQRRCYWVFAPGGQPLRACMTYADPPAVAGAGIHRVNSLDLRVVAPDGTEYWGNRGLLTGNVSQPGGEPNDRDTEEAVWIESAACGLWEVDVLASAIREDGHVETAATDADFALVVRGIGGGRDRSGMVLDLVSGGPGQLDFVVSNAPTTGWTQGWTVLSASTARHLSLGNLFGIEADALSLASFGFAPAPGGLFAFTNAGAGAYPQAPISLPSGLAAALQGVTLDGVVILADAQGKVVDVSSVDRVTP